MLFLVFYMQMYYSMIYSGSFQPLKRLTHYSLIWIKESSYIILSQYSNQYFKFRTGPIGIAIIGWNDHTDLEFQIVVCVMCKFVSCHASVRVMHESMSSHRSHQSGIETILYQDLSWWYRYRNSIENIVQTPQT